uniref:Proteasome subunit beta n=1 Tax=Acartia pacifica TaxID=335913 RepID=R9TFV9_ACAPC|nr:proteasome subunit beta type-2-like protein [Acartia pacifica]AGN29656.1 proteasome subunit beta type-2-like protein [Acartia pacifica]
MECLMGMQFNDFVMVATDQTNARSIMVMKSDEKKYLKLSDRLIMAVSGESGDTNQFAGYIQKNIQLYKMRNAYELSPSAAANFTRRNLADYLRSRTPYQVNLLLAGYDTATNQPELYQMDYLAAMIKAPYAAHGYGGFFTTTIMDRHYKADMTREQAYSLMVECVREVHKRLIINLPNFSVVVIDKDGVSEMDAITPLTVAGTAQA